MEKMALKGLLFILLIAMAAAAIAGCSKQDPADNVQPSAAAGSAGQQAAAQTATGTQQAAAKVPADTYTIKATDSKDILVMKYKIDPEYKYRLKSVTFEMRNFGSAQLKPTIMLVVGRGNDNQIKRFDYEGIPAGYKMIKNEVVDMELPGGSEPIYIKASLNDPKDKELGMVNYNYFAR